MPEICRFYGIIIRMYYEDHAPPHFHAFYEGDEVIVDIHSLSVIAGHLSARALGMVVEWAILHQKELLEIWRQAESHQKLSSIKPLP